MNGELVFLSLQQVLRLHDISLARYGGSPGVRDPGLVESALAAAQFTQHYGGGGVFEIAAAYAFHIAEAQAFQDGNKRTGVAAALTFLELNSNYRRPDELTVYNAMIAVADKQMNKSDIAALLKQLCGQEP